METKSNVTSLDSNINSVSEFIVVRHSRTEVPFRVSIESKTFDLTNYSFLRMSRANPTMQEWVLTEDLPAWNRNVCQLNIEE